MGRVMAKFSTVFSRSQPEMLVTPSLCAMAYCVMGS